MLESTYFLKTFQVDRNLNFRAVSPRQRRCRRRVRCVLLACFADQVYVGPGQLYQDLQNLLHDLNVIGQISQLIGNLKGNYQVTVEAA